MNAKRSRRTKKKTSSNANCPSRGLQKGGKFTPPTNPPDTTAHPWYPLVISTIVSPGNFSFSDLVNKFQSQLNSGGATFNKDDFNTDKGNPFRVQIRFESIAVWNLSGRIVSLSIWDVEEQTTNSTDQREKDQLGAWVDCGGPQYFPSVGYRYPSSYRERVFRPDPRYANLSIATTTAGARDSILYHVHILWRSDGTPSFATTTAPIRDLESRLESLTTAVNDQANEIKANQPSTLTKVVEGITLVASYIAPLVGEDLYSPNVSSPGDAGSIARAVADARQDVKPSSSVTSWCSLEDVA